MKHRILFTLIILFSLKMGLWAQDNALNFDGTNDYVLCPAINPTTFTAEAWIYPTVLDKDQAIISTLNEFTYVGMEMHIGSNNSPVVTIGNGSINWTNISSTVTVKANEWLHFAVTYDGTYLKIYINGILSQSATISSLNAGTNYLYIGRRSFTALPSAYSFTGKIDEVRVWNTARSQAEIAASMNTNAITGTETDLAAYYKFDQGLADGNNTGLTILTDVSPNGKNGIITNFALTGTTSNFVEGFTPNIIFISNKNNSLTFIAKSNTPGNIFVDWGDGLLKTYNIYSTKTYISTAGYIAGNTVKIYGKNIIYLDIYNLSITSLDISKSTALTYFDCAYNHLTNLDVSKDRALTYLDCTYNLLPSLDVSNNTALTFLNCSFNSLYSIDVSKNTALTSLNVCYSNLSSIDISKNTALTDFDCHFNNLTTLDVSKNILLTNLNCDINKLTFATLPQPKSTYIKYIYPMQQQHTATCTSGIVDLSAQLTAKDVNGLTQTTVYSWYNDNGTQLQKGTDYSELNGFFYFTQKPISTVYCKMTNQAFPDFNSSPLQTTRITIDTIVVPNISFISQNSDSLSFYVVNLTAGIAYVDWGDGNLTKYNLDENQATLSTHTYTTKKTVKVFGEKIYYFNVYNMGITAMDISNNLKLNMLFCNKNMLTALDVSKNPLLNTLLCNNNQLSSLDLSKNKDLQILNCSFNQLSALDVSNNPAITSLYCNYNKLTFATLPQPKVTYSIYDYAPQANLITTWASGLVDLSAQLSTKDASNNIQTTVYTWYNADNTVLPATNYSENSGVFTFHSAINSPVYCTMTNTAFPSFTNSKVFRTIDISGTITYNIEASANPSDYGTVTGAGLYNIGGNIILTALPNTGYKFVNWTENGVEVSTNENYSFTASTNRVLVANFTVISGINENSGSNFISVFPNPVKDELTIKKNNNQILNFEIVNTSGYVVYKGIIMNQTTIPISSLTPGIYFLNLENEGKIEFKKIIKE